MSLHPRTSTTPSGEARSRVLRVAPAPVVSGPAGFHRHAKRVVDVVVAVLTGTVILVPALLVGAAIRLTSRGPVLFVQERIGRDGRRFGMVKFRTMYQGVEEELTADHRLRAEYEANDFKLPPDDPRITPVGRWLRASSFDELPQLINVLRGEMSLVGVRPLLDRELALRTEYEQACYLAMQPGMTGLWQVRGRSTVRHVTRRELDVEYVEQWTLRGDLALLAKTPFAVLRFWESH